MANVFYKNLLSVIVILFATSCLMRKDEPVKMRLVNLEGKHNPVITRMPEMNAKILSSPAAFNEEKKHIIEESNKEKKQPLKKNHDMDQGDMPLVAVEADKSVMKEGEEKVASNETAKPVEVLSEDKKVAEYDLSEEKKEEVHIIGSAKKPIFIKNSKGKKVVVASPAQEKATKSSVGKKGFFVQVGSFSDSANADATLQQMQKFHHGLVDVVEGNKTIYRVLLGPYANKAKANIALRKIKASGHDAVLVRKR